MSPLSPADAKRLVGLARNSLVHGVAHGRPLVPDLAAESAALRTPGASFVTLRKADGSLRGCVGTLEVRRELALDVAENAFNAGFRDPRFPPLDVTEAEMLRIHVSALGPLEPLAAASEPSLVALLRPGRDGVVLRYGPSHATFLPEVWDALPEPRDFLRALKRKAGLPAGFWDETIEVLRYATTSIEDEPD